MRVVIDLQKLGCVGLEVLVDVNDDVVGEGKN